MVQTMQNKIVLLFGAGASNGAGHVLPCDPPLGKDVYDRLAEHSPKEWGPGSPLSHYSQGLRKNFEETMQELRDSSSPSLLIKWLCPMALYFSQFAPDSTGQDLYSKLLESLRDRGKIKDVVFASLNYDCILEQAAYKLGFQVNYFGGEVEENAIRVLKVHGSCNFITENIQQSRFLTASGVLDCEIECVQPIDVEMTLRSKFKDPRYIYYPVISLYSTHKDTLLAPSLITEIRNTWSQCVLAASTIAIIGVRPNKEDMHIWNPIKETSASKLFYIGSESAFNKWNAANQNFKCLGETFNATFDSLLKSLEFIPIKP